jgi:hypothetical protein
MILHDVLTRFERVQVEKPGQWNARCCGHEDGKNSLAISVAANGTILMKCMAGCSTGDVLAAAGLTMRDLFPTKQAQHNGSRKIVKEYDYRDERGALLYQGAHGAEGFPPANSEG